MAKQLSAKQAQPKSNASDIYILYITGNGVYKKNPSELRNYFMICNPDYYKAGNNTFDIKFFDLAVNLKLCDALRFCNTGAERLQGVTRNIFNVFDTTERETKEAINCFASYLSAFGGPEKAVYRREYLMTNPTFAYIYSTKNTAYAFRTLALWRVLLSLITLALIKLPWVLWFSIHIQLTSVRLMNWWFLLKKQKTKTALL